MGSYTSVSDARVRQDERAATAALRLLAERVAGGDHLPADHGLTPTEALLLSGELLRAVNLEVFELALWQSWGGSERGGGDD